MKEKTTNNQDSYINIYLVESFKKLGKTQSEVVLDLGKSQPYVSALMNGKKKVGKEIAKQLSGLYGFDEGLVLTGDSKSINYSDLDYTRPKGKSSIAIHDIQTLPLYDSTATLGLVEIFNNTENGNVIDHISIPNLPKSDGAIFMTGDSMYPLLKSGDIIALKIINPADIIYGEMYYVEYYGSDESSVFKVVKYVKKSDLDKDHVKLVSYNTHHDPTDILKNRIKTIAIVNASIRYNRLG